MRRLLRASSLLTLAGVLLATPLGAQTTIHGHITNDAGTPIADATVSIRSLGVGATTDASGQYSFTVPAARSNGSSAPKPA